MLKIHGNAIKRPRPNFRHAAKRRPAATLDEVDKVVARHSRDVLDARRREAEFESYVWDGHPGVSNW